MIMKKATICITANNCQSTIKETIESCLLQDYPNLEVCVMENGSTDNTLKICENYPVTIHSVKEDIGFCKNVERCFDLNTDIIILMCADDIFADNRVVTDIMHEFKCPQICHVSRYYYQFLDGKPGAVRANRSDDVYRLADNPSGLAFRIRIEIKEREKTLSFNPCGKMSERKFIEAASLVKNVLSRGRKYSILRYDTTAVRIHNNGSMNDCIYIESPVQAWYDLTGDESFIKKLPLSLIQIKKYSSYKNLFREIKTFIKINNRIMLQLDFWFFAFIAIVVPRSLLIPATEFFKDKILRRTTRIIKRDEAKNNYINSML